jgi:LysM repeat protein
MNMKKITFVVVALTLLLVFPVAGCRRAKPTVAVSNVQVTPAATVAAATGRTVVPVTSPTPTSEGAPEATPTPSPEVASPTPHAEATNTPTTAPTSPPNPTTAPTAALTAAPTATPTTAPTAAPTAVPTVAPSGETTHVVQPGENLFRISLHYGLDYQTVAAANGIINPDLISIGQTLTIPAAGTAPSTPTRTHVVQSGENLFRIALKHGVTVEAIAVANNISNVNLIHPGQRLVIP